MRALLRDRTTVIWLLLIAATCLSWFLGTDHGLAGVDARTIATVAILVVAFVKVSFVGMNFMELRNAPTPLRLIFLGYVVVVCGVVVGMSLSGT